MDIEESDFVLLAIQDLIDYNDGGHLPKSDEIVAAIQTWLGPTKYFSEHSDYRKHLNSHLSGTGSWFESSKEYQEWHDSPDTGALWIKAVAGAGKSVLSAASITRLLEENVPVLFFFFRQIVALSHESKYLIRDFLSQLLPWSPWLQHNLNKFVESNTDIESVYLDELWRYVCDALSFMPKAYCVVDALDEMDQDESFLQRLITLGKQKPASIKVLLTSRPVPRLENILRTHIPQIRLDPDGLQDDIDKYVEFKLRPIGGPPTFYETLKPIICSRACGLFLYARLVTDELIETVKDTEVRPADIPVIVDNIPKNLEDVYSKMLADHSKRSGVSTQQQLTILQWVTHTTRPLRLLEAAAIMQTIGCTATLKEAKTLVRAACGPLLEILEDETISVIHHSFTEYLCQSDRSTTNFPIIDHEETHRKIAGVCVNYLLSGALNDWKKRGIESVKDSEVRWNPYIQEQRRLKKRREFRRYSVTTSTEWKLRYPLLEYASSNWYKHSNQVHLDASLSHTLEKLFSSSILGSWVDFGIHRDYAATFTQMHIAAYIGADNILSILIQKGQSVDEKDRFGRSPISYAASGGSAAVVSILIDAGADINAYDAVGSQPIHYAAMSNHHKAINILVNAGADVLAGTLHDDEFRFHGLELKAGATAVEFATIAGHTESFLEMMHLLEQNEIHKALHLAASKGRAGVVSSILSVPGIDIDHHNTSAGFYQPPTALFEAVSYCDPPTIRLLLIGGASSTFVHTQQRDNSNNVDTAMHALAGKYGSYRRDSCSEDAFMEAFDLLVNAGCDVDQADSSGETPLHYSCWKSLDTIILRLLEKGADASKLTLNGKSVLHLYYSCTSSPEVADALIASGADINAIIPTTKIAVIHELMRGYNTSDEILRFLEYKPDVRVKDELGFTALHLFAQKRFDSAPLLKKLLELGAEVNAKDHLGRTPAHIIDIYSKHGQQYLQMFVENWGVDINATDSSGRTILLNAGRYFQDYGNPHEMKFQSMERLVELGANIHSRDFTGRGILHHAISQSDLRYFDHMVFKGLDPLTTDFFGNTLLHEASKPVVRSEGDDQIRILKHLLELGINPNSKNHRGYNILHIVSGHVQTYNDRYDRSRLFSLLCGAGFSININESNNYGIAPIHLAASISEHNVICLLNMGADPYALTVEGQSVLHIAAKGRQSNIVGLLVRRYQEDNRSDFISVRNIRHRTALHEACRAGRPEMVQILLEAGAELEIFDDIGHTPLHACAEMHEERAFWDQCMGPAGVERMHAANFMLSDALRPTSYLCNEYCNRNCQVDVEEKDCIWRVDEIVSHLIAHGARVLMKYSNHSPTALEVAVGRSFTPMIRCLSDMERNMPDNALDEERSYEKYRDYHPGQRVRCSTKNGTVHPRAAPLHRDLHTINLVDNLKSAKRENNLQLPDDTLQCMIELLRLGYTVIVPELIAFGFDFGHVVPNYRGNTALHWMAKTGFSKILQQVDASTVQRFDDLIWAATQEQEHCIDNGTLVPILLEACLRILPNLSTVKVLVDEMKVDVNAMSRSSYPTDNTWRAPLHILAEAQRWWHIDAIEFLLQRNANIEIRDRYGKTPLLVALQQERMYGELLKLPRIYRHKIVKILLKYGANPNAEDRSGKNAMNYAPELVELLVEHGARLDKCTHPPIQDAIATNNIAIVERFLRLGTKLGNPTTNNDSQLVTGLTDLNRLDMNNNKSDRNLLHIAAVRTHSRPLSNYRDEKLAIVQLLLENGSDPYAIIDGMNTVIHRAFNASDSILTPFLSYPRLDLEHRDLMGRTLLLAACFRNSDPRLTGKEPTLAHDLSREELVQQLIDRGADVTARDNKGMGAMQYLVLEQVRKKKDNAVYNFATAHPELLDLQDEYGKTALHCALRFVEVDEGGDLFREARILVEAGADVSLTDAKQETILHHLSRRMAMQKGKYDLFDLAIERGVDINSRNEDGQSPIRIFTSTMALNHRSYRSAENSAGTHTSVRYDRKDYVAELIATLETRFIANGADLYTKDNEGRGLLHALAQKCTNASKNMSDDESLRDMFDYFVRKGLNPWEEDLGQMTPLDVATAFENDVILESFRREKKEGTDNKV